VSLLATLAAALTVDGPDACISCGAPTSVHIVGGRWVGCRQPQPEPQPLVGLARILHFPAKRLDVHGASVPHGRAALAMSQSDQG
jgi:hypothetical protein